MSDLKTVDPGMMLWKTEGYAPDEGASNAQDLLEKAGLDWDVELRELFIADGKAFTEIPRRKAIVRTDTDAVLGVAKSRYVPIPNREVLAFLDNLQDTGEAAFEAAWSARGGEAVGVTMKLTENVKIADFDEHGIYLLATTTHDGGGSVRVDATPVRLSCTNMVTMAKRQAVRTYRATHTASLQHRVMEAREALDLTFAYVEAYDQLARELLDRPGDEALVAKFAEELFGDKHVERVIDRWATAENLKDVRDTRYGVLNALTEHAQWGRPRNPTVDSAVRGTIARATERAFELVSA